MPRGFGREVGREQLGARLVAEAGAVVGDLELDAAVDGARGDADATLAADGVARVLDEVDDDLRELLLVGERAAGDRAAASRSSGVSPPL